MCCVFVVCLLCVILFFFFSVFTLVVDVASAAPSSIRTVTAPELYAEIEGVLPGATPAAGPLPMGGQNVTPSSPRNNLSPAIRI